MSEFDLSVVEAAAAAVKGRTFTVVDLTERLGLPADQQSAVASWTGEDCYTASGTPRAIFDEQDLTTIITIWQADTERIENSR